MVTRKTTSNEALQQEISQMLHEAESALIVSHVRPDGDAIGSLLGLGLVLKDAGKKVQMVLVDGVPSSLRHLTGSELIKRKPQGNSDLCIVVDCSDLARTGVFDDDNRPDLNIDHHVTNLNFAKVNLVEPDEVATSAVLATYLESWGFPISEACAQSLLTGIVSDTIGFRTSNTTPQALRLAANLMEKGADLSDLYNRALVKRSFESARFWGVGLGEMQREDGLLWTALRVDERNKVNYPGNDDADLVNFLATIDDIDVAVIFVEQKEGNVKISWRAQPGLDVSKVALHFGGGGHAAAAGAMIAGPLEQVEEQVLSVTKAMLANSSEQTTA